VIDDFLTDDEAETLKEIGTPGLEPSTGTGSYTNGKFERIKMESRTSYNSWLMNGLESHPTVATVDQRISNVTGLFEGNSEHYQVLRYAATGDQFYKSHSDFIDSQVGQLCGPRLFTFFLYLQDVPEGGGGETFFPSAQPLGDPTRKACAFDDGNHDMKYEAILAEEVDCGLLVRPRARSAVLWPNVDLADFSQRHRGTNHAALAVKDGCQTADGASCFKWAANVWIHLFDFKGAHGRGLTG
jgi:prolyl 4-hydroxylase